MGPERIELSAKERERLKILQQVEEGHLKQIEAARRLHLTDWQARRLQVQLRDQRAVIRPANPRRGCLYRSSGHDPSVQGCRNAVPLYRGAGPLIASEPTTLTMK